MKLLVEVLRHAITPKLTEFKMRKCWRVDRRIACYKCWYPAGEASFSSLREYLNA